MSDRVPVQEIREALQKATPGPWDQENGDGSVGHDEYWVAHCANGQDAGQASDNAALIVLLRNNAEAMFDAIDNAERRGAVRALRRMGDLFRLTHGFPGVDSVTEGDYCHQRADAIESGADL